MSKLRLLFGLLALAAVGAVVYVRASSSNAAPAPATAASSATCTECDAPATTPALPNPYSTTPSKDAPAAPAKS